MGVKGTQGIMGDPLVRSCFHWKGKEAWTYVFLGEVYEVLQVNVISVSPDVVVNKEIELVFDPVFENKRQHPGSEFQEENNPQEHRKLQWEEQQNGHKGEVTGVRGWLWKGCNYIQPGRISELEPSVS